jgi:hypothetical protein
MTPVEAAIKALDDAIAHRARIGAQMSNAAPRDVIEQYEQAFEVEQKARKELGRLLGFAKGRADARRRSVTARKS